MDENMHKTTATVFGSTGLVGKKIATFLEEDPDFKRVFLPHRREANFSTKGIHQLINYDKLEEYDSLFQVDVIFIALGTTIKKAGSQEAFKKVDLEYPKKIALWAKKYQVKTVVLISSVGASANSSNFYLRTKGQAEKELQNILGDNLYIVRPSMLLGKREEFRLSEEIGKVFIRLFSFLLLGKLKKYKGIYDEELAKAMIYLSKVNPQQKIYHSDELKELSKNYSKLK